MNRKMREDLINNLPSDVILNILSRLDARTAVRGKCVCKPWLDLLTTPEFARSHLSKSVPRLIVVRSKWNPQTYEMVKFVEEADWCLSAFNLDLPFVAPIHCSVNGLILMGDDRGYNACTLCNPLTREYITLPCPYGPYPYRAYGFGVTRMSGEYKAVRIFIEPRQVTAHSHSCELKCQVLTIGNGLWRSIDNCIQYVRHFCNWQITFCNGFLHWSTSVDALGPRQILRLDLETELFSTFSEPPCDERSRKRYNISLSVLNGCLCVCNNWDTENDIWVMKVYGDEKSWTKEFTIGNVSIFDYKQPLYPIKVLGNGDVLVLWKWGKPFYYSSRTKTIHEIDLFELYDIHHQIKLHTPSFLSLKTFGVENVSSF